MHTLYSEYSPLMRQTLVLWLKRGIAASKPETFIGANNVFLETGKVTFGTQSVWIVLHRSIHGFCVYVTRQVTYSGTSPAGLRLNDRRSVGKIPGPKAYEHTCP